MFWMRQLLSCVIVVIIVAVGANGVAMAVSAVGQQSHCSDAGRASMADDTSGHVHGAAGMTMEATMPEHDHDTCMMHACTALSVEAIELVAVSDTCLTTLSWPEQPLLIGAQADGLKRPPKT